VAFLFQGAMDRNDSWPFILPDAEKRGTRKKIGEEARGTRDEFNVQYFVIASPQGAAIPYNRSPRRFAPPKKFARSHVPKTSFFS